MEDFFDAGSAYGLLADTMRKNLEVLIGGGKLPSVGSVRSRAFRASYEMFDSAVRGYGYEDGKDAATYRLLKETIVRTTETAEPVSTLSMCARVMKEAYIHEKTPSKETAIYLLDVFVTLATLSRENAKTASKMGHSGYVG